MSDQDKQRAMEAKGASAISLDWKDKPVTTSTQRLHVLWLFGRIRQGIAKPPHRGVQSVIEINERIGGPQPRAHLFARNNLARAFQQHGKNLEGLVLDLYSAAIAAQFSGPHVHFKGTEAHNPRSITGHYFHVFAPRKCCYSMR